MPEKNPFANKPARRVEFTDETTKGAPESKVREPLVAGEYYFTILEHKPKENQSDMDEVRLAEVETETWIWDNLVYRPKALWKVAQMLVAAGVIEEATPGMSIDIPDLTGKKIRARVYVDTTQAKPRNRISEYLPPIK